MLARLSLRVAVLGLSVLFATACTGSAEPDIAASSSPSTAANEVPTVTQRVYLATALACSKIEGQSARFTKLKVSGPGYSTEIAPVEDCKEQVIFNSYVYDVPMPETGTITISPGNQPETTLDAAKVAVSGAATVFYGREGDGRFKVTVTNYEKDEAVASAI